MASLSSKSKRGFFYDILYNILYGFSNCDIAIMVLFENQNGFDQNDNLIKRMMSFVWTSYYSG